MTVTETTTGVGAIGSQDEFQAGAQRGVRGEHGGGVANGAASGRPYPLRPSSISWQGTHLVGSRIDEAVGTLDRVLEGLQIHAGSTVALEVDDSGRTVLTVLALAARRARIILVGSADRLGAPAGNHQDPELCVVLRKVPGGTPEGSTPPTVDLRFAFTAIERGVREIHGPSPVDLTGWFAQDQALAVYSSGTTTGVSTIVWKSGAEIVENALATARAVGYGPEDVLLPLLPLSGQYGSSVLMMSTVIGAGIACCHRTRVSEVIRTINRCAVTAVDAPPLFYRHLLDELERRPDSTALLDSVRIFGVGGEGLSGRLAEAFSDATGRHLVDGYGLTQLGNVAFASTESRSVPDTPGDGAAGAWALHPVDTFTIRIADAEGRAIPEGNVGRILVRRTDGASLAGADDWFDTGDVGCASGRGFTVLGRRGMLNRNGTLIPLAWIESRLAREGIEAYAVAVSGEVSTKFWLIVHDPVRRPTEQWRRRLRGLLPEDQWPDAVQVVGFLPVDASGKVSRSRLRGLATGLQNGRAARRRDPSTPWGRLRSVLFAHREELMDLVAAVSDRQTAQHDYRAMMNVLDQAEGELHLHTWPEALPVDVFMPRNALLESYAIYCLVPSMWAERVRLRPATGTERIVSRLVELSAPAAGAPLEYTTASQRDFVDEVAQEPSVVLFTGLRGNAETVLRRLTARHVFLYFGRGVNPVVVSADADLERAATEIVYSRLYNGGQDCLAPDLVLVQDTVADRMIELLAAAAADYVSTNGGRLAPLAKEDDFLRALRYLTENSAGLISGGQIDFPGRTFSPAIVRVDGQEMARPFEHFAPVFSVATFEDQEQVRDLLRSDFHRENGFGAAFYGGDPEIVRSMTDHYLVSFNQSLVAAIPPFEPFGGHGVESGFVSHRGRKVLGPVNITQTAVRFGPSLRKKA